jgi:hypothetical protein
MKKGILIILAALFILLLAGCTAGPNPSANTPGKEGKIAGFWQGLWQGFITPVTFIISLFNKTVHIYEVHNNGGWYNAGFLLGASAILGGGAAGGASANRQKKEEG